MNHEDVDAFPLTWPLGWPRAKGRVRAKFGAQATRGSPAGTTYTIRRDLTLAEGRDRLLDELKRIRATAVVISTNVRTRADGELYGNAANPADPGAAAYFRLKNQPRVLACDRWDRLADNLAAIAAHIGALRAIDRWGVGSMEQAFAGYLALTAVGAKKPWWEILGVSERATAAELRARYLELAERHHPDRGGNPNQMAEINAAYDEAVQLGLVARHA